MKSYLPVLLTLITFSLFAQPLSTTFKPYIKETPGLVHVKAASDGNYFVFGRFEMYANTRTNLLKINSTADPVAGFQNHIFDRQINNVSELPSGKVLVGGSFHFRNGNSTPTLIRLNADGSVDNSFLSSETRTIIDFVVQSTGKIIIVTYDSQYHLVRLNSDGTPDATFNSNGDGTSNFSITSGFNSLAVDTNNNIYCSKFQSLFRLTANGDADHSFSMPTTDISNILNFTLMADGRLLVSVEKIVSLTPYYQTENHLIRVAANGTIDNTFLSPPADGAIDKPVVRPNGKVVVVGSYYNFNGNYSSGAIIELNDDGSYSQTIASCDFAADELTQDSNGNIFVSGLFKTINYVKLPWVAKIKSDNSIDNTFKADVSSSGDLFYIGTGMQSGNRLIAGSGFNWIGMGDNRDKLVRILPDGTRDNTFVPALRNDQNNTVNPTVNSVAVQEDDKIIVGGSRVFQNQAPFGRLLPDGGLDTSFKMGSGPELVTAFGVPSVSKVLYNNSKIYVFGRFEAFDGHPSNGMAILDKDGKWIGTASPSFLLNGGVVNTALQSDGKILLQGYGMIEGNDSPVIRLNADGTVDNTFQLTIQGNINIMTVDSSDNIWIGGSFIDFITGRLVAKFDKEGTRLPNPAIGGNTEDILYSAQGLPGGLMAFGGFFKSFSGNQSPGVYIVDADNNPVYSSLFDEGSFASRFFCTNGILYAFGSFSQDHGQDISSVRKFVFDITTLPTSFTATANGDKATLSWSGDFVGAESIIIEQSLSQDNGYQQIGKVSTTVRLRDTDALNEATRYYFRITGSNEFYTSDGMVASVVMPVKPEKAMAPSDITVNSFVANWEFISGTDSVMLQVSKDNFSSFLAGFDKKILKTGSVKIAGLEEGKAYQYRVKRYKNGLSSEFSAPVVANVISGVEDNDHGISIYPNPVADFLRVRIEDQSGARFTLRSVTGAMIIDQVIDGTDSEFDVGSVGAGMYIATIESGSMKKDYKVILK